MVASARSSATPTCSARSPAASSCCAATGSRRIPRRPSIFVEQSARALDYAREHPEETKAIFAKALEERGENPEVAQYFRGYGVREGGLPVDRDIQFWIDVLVREGKLPQGKLVAKDILLRHRRRRRRSAN